MSIKPSYYPSWLILFAIPACFSNNQQPSTGEEALSVSNSTIQVDTRVPVKAVPVQVGDFPLQILTNGTVTADQQVDIKVRSSGRIEELPVVEGQYIEKGDLLCRQEDEALRLELAQKQVALDEAWIKLNELVILQGGENDDTASIESKILQTLKTTSGWNAAVQHVRQTEYLLAQTRLAAPFSGLVARRQLKLYQEAQQGEVLCTLIDPETYEVTFTLLEKDAGAIRNGQSVVFYPQNNAGVKYHAAVYRIDPIIDENGLLTVKAKISGQKTNLYPGMNARVIIEEHLHRQLIVPREALVLRSNREVIFVADTLSNLAKWKYVTVGQRNDQGLTITEGLEPADLVIVEGNLNLAHDAEIVIK